MMNNITEEDLERKLSSSYSSETIQQIMSEDDVNMWLDTHEDFVLSYFSRKAIKLLNIRSRQAGISPLPRIITQQNNHSSTNINGTDLTNMHASLVQSLNSIAQPQPIRKDSKQEFTFSPRKLSGLDSVSSSGTEFTSPRRKMSSDFNFSPCNTPPNRKVSLELLDNEKPVFQQPVQPTNTPARKTSGLDRPALTHSISSTGSDRPSRKVSSGSVGAPKPHCPSWSGTSTPVRKLSTMSSPDIEKNLKRIISGVGGSPSFISEMRNKTRSVSRMRKSNYELKKLKKLNEEALLIELVGDIANDLETTSLCHKILQNVSILINADRCSLFLVNKFTEGHKTLVSKVMDVNADSNVVDVSHGEEIEVPWGMGIVGYVAQTGQPVNIDDAYSDPRFNRDVDKRTGYETRSLLCMPIKCGHEEDGTVEVIGVAQVLNKNGPVCDGGGDAFTDEDKKIFEKYLTFCGIGITNAQLFERLEIELKRNEVLLDLARVIFEDQSTLEKIVHKIMHSTQSLIQCERCSLLLVNPSSKNSFYRVFDLEAGDFYDDDDAIEGEKAIKNSEELNFPINVGITDYVANTGETLNIVDAYEDKRFDPKVEEDTDFRTQTILCMPVRSSKGEIIGVVQLVNKMSGKPFNANDENLFEAFAIFCGMAINNTSMYEECMKAWARQKIALDVLSYHATASDKDATELAAETIPTTKIFRLREFSFDDATLDDHETVLATVRMFTDLNLIERFRIDYRKMCSFVLTVQKNYRRVVYHNWRHAFNVAQTMFVMLKENQEMKDNFSDEEKCALIIGCLCHDIDHRGLNNSFQVQSQNPLALLYGTSVMERHHLDHTIMILHSSGNEVLNTLSPEEYNVVIKVMEQAILATDLALYFKKHKDYFSLVKNDSFEWKNDDHRSLLRSMMMTACDLSAICKPWPVQKRVAYLVAEEFFQQGDLERQELNIDPIDMMNRKKQEKFPAMQVGYVDNVCMPIYQHLSEQYDEFKPMIDFCKENRKNWKDLADKQLPQVEASSADKKEKE